MSKDIKPISAAKRIEYYKEAIKRLRKLKAENETQGICVLLGDIACEGYFNAPWIGWGTCSNYFPEMKKVQSPRSREGYYPTAKEYSNLRIQVLKELIAAVPK